MQSNNRYRPLKIGDFVIILIFLSALFFIPRVEGKKVRVIVDKEKEFIYPLNEDRILKIEGKIGIIMIEIKDGRVRVIESTCPLKICMEMGWIKNKGEQIVCVPNRILICIEGEQFDAITE